MNSEAHKAKMEAKRNGTWRTSTSRLGWVAAAVDYGVPANINRHTGKPHLDLRERARRRFAAGTINRKVSYRDATEGKELVSVSYGHLNTGKRHKKVGQAYLDALAKEPF